MILLKYYFLSIIIINTTYARNDSNTGLELNQINVNIINDKNEQSKTQNNMVIIKNNVSDSSQSIESSNYITTLIKTIVIKCRPRNIITDDIDEISLGTDRKYTSRIKLPSESIDLYSKSEEKRSTTKEVVVPMNTLEMKPTFDKDICAICYNKFSYFPWQENAKGTLKIKTYTDHQIQNHHIHEKILCKKCIKYMIQMKANCPYCREPIDVPAKVNTNTAVAITRRERINTNTAVAIPKRERINITLPMVFFSIKQSRLFNKMKNSIICNFIGHILMVPAFLIATPFILLLMLFTEFMIFKDDDQNRRDCVYCKRLIVGTILLFVLVGKSVEN